MSIKLSGKNDDERRAFASGYIAGMQTASNLCTLLAQEACGGSGQGGDAYQVAAEHIRTRIPKGEIVTTHELR